MAQEKKKKVRLDKWLWAARFYKTRSQAAEATRKGRIDLEGDRAKPSSAIGIGAQIEVRKGPYRFAITVLELSEKRGKAEIAQKLYRESEDSIREREELRQRLAAERVGIPPLAQRGRPTKKARRQLMAFRQAYLQPEDIDDLD